MEELVAPLIGLLIGLMALDTGRHRSRLAVPAIAIALLAGVVTTWASGEYRMSWLYVVVDCGTGGLGVGAAAVALRLRRRALSITRSQACWRVSATHLSRWRTNA